MSRVMTLHASALPSFRKHCWVWLISVTALLGACEEPTSIEDRWELSQPGRYATLNADCAACIVGPRVFFRAKGEPITETIEFQGTSDASYIIDIDDGASQGADGAVTLNGEVLLAPRTAMETGPRRVRKPITLKTTNQLDVRLTGKPGSVLTITLLGGVESIGATGGTVVAHGGGARVTIPPGALSSALEITVIDSDDPTAATTNQKKRVTLLPEGTTFSIPVELVVVVPTGVRESAGLFLKEGPWLSWSPTDIDLATSTLRVQTTHFSTWVALDYTAYPPGTYSASYIPSVGPASRASTGTPLTEAELAAELANALAQWRPALRDYDVAFNAAAGLPDIEIAFGPQPMNQQGQAYRWDQAIQLNDGRNPRHLRKIVVNSLFRWEGLNDPGVRDPNRTAPILVNLLAHELGHAIGIKHVSPSGDASLMGQGGLGIHPLALGLDERVAVGVVYGGLSNPPPQTYREAVRLEAASSLTVTGLSGGSVSELPTVRAVNSQGDPVPGVPVYFRVEGAESGTIAGTAGVTKDDGTFTLGQWLLASGTSAPQEIKAQAHLPSKLAQSDQEVTFIATVATIPEETSSVIGTVTSTQLGPLAGVTVTMAGDGASQSTVTSAPLGDYAFQEVKPGTATLSISNLPIGCTDPGPMVVVLIAGIPSHAHFSVSCQQQQSSLPVGLYFNSGLPLETSTVSYHNSTYELREGGAFESIHEQTEKFGQLAGHHRTVVTGTWNHLPRDQWFVLSAYCGSSLGGFIRIRQREIIRTYVSAVPGHEGETTVTRGLSPLDDTYAFCEAGGGLPALLRNSPLFVPSTYWGMR